MLNIIAMILALIISIISVKGISISIKNTYNKTDVLSRNKLLVYIIIPVVLGLTLSLGLHSSIFGILTAIILLDSGCFIIIQAFSMILGSAIIHQIVSFVNMSLFQNIVV